VLGSQLLIVIVEMRGICAGILGRPGSVVMPLLAHPRPAPVAAGAVA
jgi:hypothetical protein